MARQAERPGRAWPGHPRPRKRFGQHFLEAAWVAKVVQSLHALPTDTFLEIGPGRGAITLPLAPLVNRLLAVEIDRDLADALAPRLPSHAVLVRADFLDIDVPGLLANEPLPIRLVGNLPYNVSSPILFSVLRAADAGASISDATFMLQKEVADRLAAKPGDSDYGALAIQAALTADIDRVLVLPPGAFRPPPKIWSAVVRLRFRPPSFDPGPPGVYERIVRGVFLHRRKTLANALKPVAEQFARDAADLLEKAGLDGSQRPETLSPADYGRLARAVL